MLDGLFLLVLFLFTLQRFALQEFPSKHPFQRLPIRFEWVDGALTVAVEKGGWLLLRGANLAAAAVLDRLNRWGSSKHIPMVPEGADASVRVPMLLWLVVNSQQYWKIYTYKQIDPFENIQVYMEKLKLCAKTICRAYDNLSYTGLSGLKDQARGTLCTWSLSRWGLGMI